MRAGFRFDFLIAAATALLTAAAMFLIWEGNATEEQNQATGDMLADLAARASIDGLIDRNRIELGVVANRLTRVPQVAGVAIFTVENEPLALSGSLEHGTPFIRPIVLDDTLIGFARISLVPPATAPEPLRVAASALTLLTIALLVAWWSARMRGGATRQAPGSGTDTDTEMDATTSFLLVGNLHSQFSLSGSQRRQTAERALAFARRVGQIYPSRTEQVPGTGLLMTFPALENNDSAFEAAFAALALAKCLAGDPAVDEFRFGLHVAEVQAGESPSDRPSDRHAALDDASLLAAAGKPGGIVASEPFFAHLGEAGRLEAEPFSHPMLEQLHAADKRCRLITGVESGRRPLLERQASRLADDSLWR